VVGRRRLAALVTAHFLLLAGTAQAASPATGFETGLGGWEATGPWSVRDHPERITVSPTIGGHLSDVPAGTALPLPAEGTHAAWFGDPASGTYCIGYDELRQHPSDGCTSNGVVRGTLTSPSFATGAGPVTVTFRGWWEISGGSPDLTDLMLVEYSVDGATWTEAGRLNPDAPPWGSRHQLWSAAGHKGAGEWDAYSVELPAAAGHEAVRVRFRFDSVDEYGQGFRGLLVDDVKVSGVLEDAAETATQLVLGARFTSLAPGGAVPRALRRGATILLAPEDGVVTYTLPGRQDDQTLTKATYVPVGTLVDATDGHVHVTTATDEDGGIQDGSFYDGLFQILQQPGDALVDLVLRGGSFPHCDGICDPAAARARSSSNRIRRLWGNAHGRFRTRGRYACATVRGTWWLVEDRVDGSLVRVRRGSVLVSDYVLRRDKIVNAGESYFAKALYVNKQKGNPRFQRRYSLFVRRDGRIVHVYAKSKIGKIVLTP